jgi:hypothetical protein
VTLPYPDEDYRQTCPFTYLVSLVQAVRPHSAQPALNHPTNLRSQFLNEIDSRLQIRAQSHPQSHQLSTLRQLRLSPISTWSYETWAQHWLEPIIDFSIPSDQVYDRIPAWQLLDSTQPRADLSE